MVPSATPYQVIGALHEDPDHFPIGVQPRLLLRLRVQRGHGRLCRRQRLWRQERRAAQRAQCCHHSPHERRVAGGGSVRPAGRRTRLN